MDNNGNDGTQQKERKYIGKGKVIGTFGSLAIGLRFGGNVEEAVANFRKLVNERGYVNIIVAKRKEVDDRNNTHTVYIDEHIPKPRQGGG